MDLRGGEIDASLMLIVDILGISSLLFQSCFVPGASYDIPEQQSAVEHQGDSKMNGRRAQWLLTPLRNYLVGFLFQQPNTI